MANVKQFSDNSPGSFLIVFLWRISVKTDAVTLDFYPVTLKTRTSTR